MPYCMQAEEVRQLNARAQGEVAIREALQEVTVWSQEAAFSLIEHDENGRQTPLIKDWKDMTTAISVRSLVLGLCLLPATLPLLACTTYGCSLQHPRLQPAPPTVAACTTYGCRI